MQWTPSEKYFDWAEQNNLDPYDIDTQLARIQDEVVGNVDQWIATCHSSNMSFEEFIKSDKSPEELAEIFLRCYERPENKIQPIRGEQAADWKEILVVQKGETQCKI